MTPPSSFPGNRRPLAAVALPLVLALAGCATGASYGSPDTFGPELVRRGGEMSLSVEERPAYVSLFTMSRGVVLLEYPYVPFRVAQTRWPFFTPPSNASLQRFLQLNPGVDLENDPVTGDGDQPVLEPGEPTVVHPPPWAFGISRTPGRQWRYGAAYHLMVTTESPQRLHRLVELGDRFLPPDPREISELIVETLGLEEDDPGWSAVLYRGSSRRALRPSVAVQLENAPSSPLPSVPIPPSGARIPPGSGGGG